MFALLSSPDPVDVMEAEPDQPCLCVDCQAEGAEAEFIWHEKAGGALCPECINEREPNCHLCGHAFARHGLRERSFYTPAGELRCWHCNDLKKSEKPQPDLTADEATDEARVAFMAYPFDDDDHRNRFLYRSRERLKNRRNSEQSASKKGKLKIEAAWIDSWAKRTRRRSLETLASEYYANAIEYDEAMRTGAQPIIAENDSGHYCARTIWQKRADELMAEANFGTSFGQSVNRRPQRMLTLVRWWARRDGRLPMWGVGSKWRIEMEGTHYIIDTRRFGLSVELDRDKHQPGHPCHSSTGYRSFTGGRDFEFFPEPDNPGTVEQWARNRLDTYLNGAKTKHGDNLAGKRERWIPFEAEPWARQQRDKARTLADGLAPYDPEYRLGHPAMIKPEDRAEYWRDFDTKANAAASRALAWMEARGVDPYELFPDIERQEALL